jgi:hypothetical protein
MTERMNRGKRKLVAGAAATLLAVAAIAASASAASAERQDIGINEVAPGAATLHYDWGCDGSYSVTSIDFAADGSYSTGEGSAGRWVRVEGQLLFKFSGLETTYGSVVSSRTASGIQTTFAGFNGCHYLTAPGALTTAANTDSHNADGS